MHSETVLHMDVHVGVMIGKIQDLQKCQDPYLKIQDWDLFKWSNTARWKNRTQKRLPDPSRATDSESSRSDQKFPNQWSSSDHLPSLHLCICG